MKFRGKSLKLQITLLHSPNFNLRWLPSFMKFQITHTVVLIGNRYVK